VTFDGVTFDGVTPLTAGLLAVAALTAGWVDAVVGGGGLVQLPALLIGLPGAGPAQLLATNKLASVCGTATAAGTYYRRVRPDLATALPMAALALGGAAAGAACASLLPARVFRPMVLVMLVAVAGYVWRRPDVGEITALRFAGLRHRVTAGAVGAGIGFYDGIFGPGTGSFLVVTLVGLLGYAFLAASAKAKIVNLATNVGALLVFIPQGAPLWRVGLLMGLANLTGGYLGARTAVAAGNRFIRASLLVVVAILVLRVGWDVAHGR
jgi:hypothetical protein